MKLDGKSLSMLKSKQGALFLGFREWVATDGETHVYRYSLSDNQNAKIFKKIFFLSYFRDSSFYSNSLPISV